jgi:hypothetical protein
MDRKEKFNQVLDEALDRLIRGESPEKIVSDYPEQSTELKPLLQAASAARVFNQLKPREDFKSRARYEFLSAAREMESRPRRRFSFSWNWRPAWAISLTAAVVVLLAGSGTVAASGSSMPGDTLYQVKLTTEKVRLAVAFSDLSKTELNASFANRRSVEIEYLSTQGNNEQIQVAASRLNYNLSNISTLTGNKNTLDSDSSAGPANAVQNNYDIAATPSQAAQVLVVPASGQGTEPSPSNSNNRSTVTNGMINKTEPAVLPAPALLPPEKHIPQASQDSIATRSSNSTFVPNSLSFNNSEGQKSTNNQSNSKNKFNASKNDRLRKIVEENYQARQSSLKAALEKAKPELRSSILQALADSEAEYWQSIRNLDNNGNHN